MQGLQSVEEHLWRNRDKYAAQLDDRLTLRKLLLDNEDTIQLVVAIRYVSPHDLLL
jgi:hypothetical protein